MSFVPTFPWVRTNARGGSDQLSSRSPPYETVERGSEVSMGTEGLMNGLSSVLCPQVRERGQGRTHPSYFPIPTPGLAEMRKELLKLSVKESL
jgi:hypothetical protein